MDEENHFEDGDFPVIHAVDSGTITTSNIQTSQWPTPWTLPRPTTSSNDDADDDDHDAHDHHVDDDDVDILGNPC